MATLPAEGPKGSRWTHGEGGSSLCYGGRNVVYVDRRSARRWFWSVPQLHRTGEATTRAAAIAATEAIVREALGLDRPRSTDPAPR